MDMASNDRDAAQLAAASPARHLPAPTAVTPLPPLAAVIDGGMEDDDDVLAPGEALVMDASEGNFEEVVAAVEDGVEVDSVDAEGTTALIAAAFAGHVDIVMFLLQQGASPAAVNATFRWTALMAAAFAGSAPTVRVLLDAGSAVNHVDTEVRRPLGACTPHHTTPHVQPRVQPHARAGQDAAGLRGGRGARGMRHGADGSGRQACLPAAAGEPASGRRGGVSVSDAGCGSGVL